MAYHSWKVVADTMEELDRKLAILFKKYHPVYGFHTVGNVYQNPETKQYEQTVARYDCE